MHYELSFALPSNYYEFNLLADCLPKAERLEPFVPKTAHSSRHNTCGAEDKLRSKTAPERGRRKNWAAVSFELQTNQGEKVKVKPPGEKVDFVKPLL